MLKALFVEFSGNCRGNHADRFSDPYDASDTFINIIR